MYFALAQAFVTRKNFMTGQVFGQGEEVSREDAMRMATVWAASYQGDDEIGSLEPGKLGDLVITNRDYMTVPESEIHQVRAVATIVGGRVVYDRDALFGTRIVPTSGSLPD
jgi:predicted amidohydrolase YtcJ